MAHTVRGIGPWLLLALVVRLLWLSIITPPEPIWDAARFDKSSQVVGAALRNPIEAYRSISVAQLRSAASQPAANITDSDANELVDALRVFVSRGPIYPALLSVIRAIFGADLMVVRLFQVLLDLVSIFLLWKISQRVLVAPWALIPPLILALWPASILSNALLLQETLFTTLLLALVFSWLRFLDEPSKRRALTMVTLLLLVGLTRTSHQAMIVLFPAFLLFPGVLSRNELRAAIPMLLLLIAVVGSWLLSTWAILGHPQVLGGRLGNSVLYEVSAAGRSGWAVDALRTEGGRASRVEDSPALYEASGGHTAGDRRVLVETPSEDVLRRAAVGRVLRDPRAWAFSVLSRAHRLWRYPYNDYRLPVLLVSPSAQARVHVVVILVGVFGIPLTLRAWRCNAAWLLVIAYSTGVYAVYNIESRYNAPLLPFVFLAAAFAMRAAWSGVLDRQRCWGKRRTISYLIFLLALVIIVSIRPQVPQVSSGITRVFAAAQILAAKILLLVLAIQIGRAAISKEMCSAARFGVLATILALGTITALPWKAEAGADDCPSLRLPDFPTTLQGEIRCATVHESERASLLLNLSIPIHAEAELWLQIEDSTYQMSLDSIAGNSVYKHFEYPRYFALLERGTPVPVWLEVQLPPEALTDGVVGFSLAVINDRATHSPEVRLNAHFGDTPSLPAQSNDPWMLSFYRLITVGDARLRVPEQTLWGELRTRLPEDQEWLPNSWGRLDAFVATRGKDGELRLH